MTANVYGVSSEVLKCSKLGSDDVNTLKTTELYTSGEIQDVKIDLDKPEKKKKKLRGRVLGQGKDPKR